MIPYSVVRYLITSAVVGIEDDDVLVNVKRYQKQKWLKDMLESDARDDIIIDFVDYEDVKIIE